MKLIRVSLAALLVLTAWGLAWSHGLADPGKPKNLTATADGPYAVDLDWKRVSGAEFYNVYRDGTWIAEASRSSYRDEELEPATTYVYRVSAVDDDGDEGDLSDPAQVTTDPLPGPTTPTDLVATVMGWSRIDLTWSPSKAEAGIAYYRVFRDGSELATTGETSYEDSGLTPETMYEYRVSAVDNEEQESDASEPASATTSALPPPPPPENVTASALSSSQINVSWTDPPASETPVAGYNVYRDGDFVGFVVGTTFGDTGLAAETTYRYTVSTIDDRNIEGEQSEEASATTDAAQDVIPPAPPTGLRLAGS